jgi:small subunit ribosomal protein S20
LANKPSAKKRIRQTIKRTARNKTVRTRARTYVRYARQMISEGKKKEAAEAVQRAASELDRAAAKGVIHQNNAARRKSRLMNSLAKMS